MIFQVRLALSISEVFTSVIAHFLVAISGTGVQQDDVLLQLYFASAPVVDERGGECIHSIDDYRGQEILADCLPFPAQAERLHLRAEAGT